MNDNHHNEIFHLYTIDLDYLLNNDIDLIDMDLFILKKRSNFKNKLNLFYLWIYLLLKFQMFEY